MFKPINGFTKEKIIETLLTRNNGTRCVSNATITWGAPKCCYESNGNHCAVGCFIPDGHPGMRVPGDAESLIEDHPDLKECMPLELDALLMLQSMHDLTNVDQDLHTILVQWINENVED